MQFPPWNVYFAKSRKCGIPEDVQLLMTSYAHLPCVVLPQINLTVKVTHICVSKMRKTRMQGHSLKHDLYGENWKALTCSSTRDWCVRSRISMLGQCNRTRDTPTCVMGKSELKNSKFSVIHFS